MNLNPGKGILTVQLNNPNSVYTQTNGLISFFWMLILMQSCENEKEQGTTLHSHCLSTIIYT